MLARPLAFIVTLGVLLLPGQFASSAGQKPSVRNNFAVGGEAPNFSATDQYGRNFDLKSLRGKWVLLDFCASWCPSCDVLDSYANRMAALLRQKRVPFEHVILLMQNEAALPSTQEDAVEWALKWELTSPVVSRNGQRHSQDILHFHQLNYALAALRDPSQMESLHAYPTVALIDPRGRVRFVAAGVPPPEDLFRVMKLRKLRLPGPFPLPPQFGLLDNTLTITSGNALERWSGLNATWQENQSTDPSHPTLGLVAAQGATVTGTYARIRYFLTGTPTAFAEAPPLPHDLPITLSFSNPVWNERGEGSLLPGRTEVNFFDRSVTETRVSFAPNVSQAGEIVLGPFSIDSLGIPAERELVRLACTLSWVRPEPLAQAQLLVQNVAELGLAAPQASLLSVAFEKVRGALAPEVPTTTALQHLDSAVDLLQQLATAESGAQLAVAEEMVEVAALLRTTLSR